MMHGLLLSPYRNHIYLIYHWLHHCFWVLDGLAPEITPWLRERWLAAKKAAAARIREMSSAQAGNSFHQKLGLLCLKTPPELAELADLHALHHGLVFRSAWECVSEQQSIHLETMEWCMEYDMYDVWNASINTTNAAIIIDYDSSTLVLSVSLTVLLVLLLCYHLFYCWLFLLIILILSLSSLILLTCGFSRI
jgi:hypothetical protein